MKTFEKLFITSLFIFLFSCNKDENTPKSSDKEIISFEIGNYSASIDLIRNYIELTLPSGTPINELKPVIEISEKAIITPGSETVQDFSEPVVYIVQAEDGSKQQYTVNIKLEKSSDARIRSFSINGVEGEIKDNYTSIYPVEANSIIIKLKGVTDVTELKPIIKLPTGAKISPTPDIELDFSRPVVYTITAENGQKNTYTIGVQYDTYPSGLLYTTKIRNTNRITDITTNYAFNYNHINRLTSFSKTTKPFYIDDNLVDGDVVCIKYDDNDKISQLVLEERADNVAVNTRTLNVFYPDSKTVHITETLTNGSIKKDVITLNERNKVSKFETKDKTEFFVYDKSDNVIEHTILNGGYKKIEYDNYNGSFSYFDAPHWLLLYTTEELIGTGLNNPIVIDAYKQSGELIETIEYEYKYDSLTRYPQTYTYQTGGEEFKGIVFFNYVFPYQLDLRGK